MKTLLGSLLALSLALNVFLWSRLASHSPVPRPDAAVSGEIEELRRQNQNLEARRKAATDAADADALELARLRNEVGRLRQEAAALPALRAQAAELQAQLKSATQNLAEANLRMEQITKLSPEQIQAMKEEADSIRCASNLKQIELSARLWAMDNQDMFPPDFISMKDELDSPKVLFCPSNPAGIQVTDWSQLNPAQISYQYLIPGIPTGPIIRQAFICPFHGHVAMSDGYVQRK